MDVALEPTLPAAAVPIATAVSQVQDTLLGLNALSSKLAGDVAQKAQEQTDRMQVMNAMVQEMQRQHTELQSSFESRMHFFECALATLQEEKCNLSRKLAQAATRANAS